MTKESSSTIPKRCYRIAIGTFFFLQGFTFASWAARIPDFKAVFSLSDGALGTLLLAFPLGQLLGVPLSGYWVERFTSRRSLLAAALLYPFTLVCLGAVPLLAAPQGPMPPYAVWVFAFVLFLLGLLANLHNLSVNTQAVGVEKLYGRSIMATFHGLWSLAGFVAGLLGTLMAARSVIPFYHYLCVLAMGLLVVIFLHPYTLRQDIVSEASADSKPTFNIFKGMDSFVLLLGFLAFGGMFCEGAMYDWSAVYFDQILHVDETRIRMGYTACMLAMAVCRFLADRVVNRFGAATLMRINGLLTAHGYILIVFAHHLIPATIGAAMVGVGVSSIVPVCYGVVSRHKGVVVGRAINAVSTIGFFGFVIGPPIIGHLAQWIGLRWVFAMIAALAFSIAFAGGKLRR